jgi:excisionase family DNA binding protein
MERQRQHLKQVLQPLKQVLEAHRRSLEELESALIEFEETLNEPEQRPEHPQAQQGGGLLLLLSIPEVCQELGMGKSWVYGHIRSREIPSVKLGRNIKVRREDLEGYLEDQRYQPASGLVG